jgi:hypothetical protein
MKQVFLLSLMILSLVSCTGKKEQLCTSSWQGEAITIDGLNKDWGGTLQYSDTTAKLTYDVRNDSVNLYLIVETNDNSMKMKLMHTGLKVSMGLKSDPKTTAVITLPAFRGNPFMHHYQGMPDSACKGGTGPMPEMKDAKCAKPCKEMKDAKCAKSCGAMKDSASCAKHCKEMKDQKCPMKDQKGAGKGKPMPDSICHKGLMPGMEGMDSAACMKMRMPMREPATAEGFKFTNGKIEGCNAEKGKISFAVGMNETKTLTYEIVVPLRELYGDGYDLSRVASDKIRLEITVEAMEKHSGRGMMPGGPHPGEGSPDSLAGHHGEGMAGGPAGVHEGKPMGKPECKPEGKPEGRWEGKHEGKPEGMGGECMHGAPPEGMGQPFAMPDTLILFQKQSIQCKVTLAKGK